MYYKGIFGNGLRIEDDWKERRERETNMHTRENFGKVKTREKGHIFCIVGNESKSHTYLKI